MTSSWFDPGSTSKILNLSLLRFNERSGSENLGINSQRQEQQLTRTCFIVFNAFLLWFLCVWVFWGGFMIPYQSSTCLFLKKKKIQAHVYLGIFRHLNCPFVVYDYSFFCLYFLPKSRLLLSILHHYFQ